MSGPLRVATAVRCSVKNELNGWWTRLMVMPACERMYASSIGLNALGGGLPQSQISIVTLSRAAFVPASAAVAASAVRASAASAVQRLRLIVPSFLDSPHQAVSTIHPERDTVDMLGLRRDEEAYRG